MSDGTERMVALVGPLSSGKSLLRDFLLVDPGPPDYIEAVHSVLRQEFLEEKPQFQDQEGGPSRFEFSEDGAAMGRVAAATTAPVEIQVRYYDEKNAEAAECRLVDFNGEAFNIQDDDEALRAEERQAAEENRERLQQASQVVLLVPYWHLLPPSMFRLLKQSDAFDRAHITAVARHPEMAKGMHYWVGALERLAHDKQRRRLTVAISQVGGKELISEILDVLYRRRRRGDFDHETFDALCDLNGALAALDELEDAPVSGLGQFRTRYRALLLIRDLRSRAQRYLECCSAGENPSARAIYKKLLRHPHFETSLVAFNLVDGLGDKHTKHFKRELRSPHLTLMNFWQEATRDWVW